MKKLLILLFSLLISFNSYGEWTQVSKDINNFDLKIADLGFAKQLEVDADDLA